MKHKENNSLNKFVLWGLLIILVIFFILMVNTSNERKENIKDLCIQMGYKSGTWELLQGNSCLEEKCIRINNVENCSSNWISVGTLRIKEVD